MDSESSQVEMFFLPFVGGGHQIPMIDLAKTFALHGAKTTIITTSKHALSFQKSIDRHRESGYQISIHTLLLPDNIDISDTDLSASPFTDTSMLQEPLKNFLLQSKPKPDCIVHDMFHRWAPDVIDSLTIARIVFNGSGCFPRCVLENIGKYKPDEMIGSDFEPFLVPYLPDRIELTRSQIPIFLRQPNGSSPPPKTWKPETSFGNLVNSFHELEPSYVEYFKEEFGNNSWLVGPVSQCNNDLADKVDRGQKPSVDERMILNFLECQEPNSVLYISFGSLARLTPEQLTEIAYGLEASDHPFVWVIGKTLDGNQDIQLPDGFAERIKNTQKGLIIRGWAPQLMILEHESVGGFMTHCGWNSTLEGVSAGVAMITWPITAEQFVNEKLITDVLRIGLKVGSIEWLSLSMKPTILVKRKNVEMAVKRLMGGGEGVVEMRVRARELAVKAKKAVEEGGSSFKDVDDLIKELKSRRESK